MLLLINGRLLLLEARTLSHFSLRWLQITRQPRIVTITPTQSPYGIRGWLLPPLAQQSSYYPCKALASAVDCSRWWLVQSLLLQVVHSALPLNAITCSQEIVSCGNAIQFLLNLCSLVALPTRGKLLHPSCSYDSRAPKQSHSGIRGWLLPPLAQQPSYFTRKVLAPTVDCSHWWS